LTRFELRRQKQRCSDRPLRQIRLKHRKVDVYLSNAFVGTPFTGGILRPFVCFPEASFSVLDEAEREAVIQHEIAHVCNWDWPATLVVKVLGDLFWFIPFYRFLSRRIDHLREFLADQIAVRAGASGPHLASALIKLKEVCLNAYQPALNSAFFREPRLLKTRVHELLGIGLSRPSRFGWNTRYARVLICGWTAGAVLMATFGGNYQIRTSPNPKWFDGLIERVME
jgi:beta-lactamase regulating signal transducer with metallopeptidase domain